MRIFVSIAPIAIQKWQIEKRPISVMGEFQITKLILIMNEVLQETQIWVKNKAHQKAASQPKKLLFILRKKLIIVALYLEINRHY